MSTLTLVQDDFKPYHLGFEVNTTATVISGFATVAGNETKLASFRPPLDVVPINRGLWRAQDAARRRGVSRC